MAKIDTGGKIMSDLYSAEAQERRDKFNRIINGIDMVLMNNIPEVDYSVMENWQGKSPISEQCDIEDIEHDDYAHKCITHDELTNNDFECDEYEGDMEVYQWFAINQSDVDFLKERNQYITYSDTLDTYFLAICHFGTSWDYVESMVSDILGETEGAEQ